MAAAAPDLEWLPTGVDVVVVWAPDARAARRLRASWSTEARVLVVAERVPAPDGLPAEAEWRVVEDLAAARALAAIDGLAHPARP